VAYQLYLPQDWAEDRERRREVTALGLTYVAGIVPTTTVWATAS
jgi:SRSO17 transposase